MVVSSFMCITRSRGKWWPLTLRCYLHYWSMMTPCDEGKMTCGGLLFLLEAFLAWAVHEHLVSYITLLFHSFIMSSFCPFFCGSWHFVWTFCSSHSYKRLVDNTYPKEYTKMIWSKGSVIVELKVILYAITELVFTF